MKGTSRHEVVNDFAHKTCTIVYVFFANVSIIFLDQRGTVVVHLAGTSAIFSSLIILATRQSLLSTTSRTRRQLSFSSLYRAGC